MMLFGFAGLPGRSDHSQPEPIHWVTAAGCCLTTESLTSEAGRAGFYAVLLQARRHSDFMFIAVCFAWGPDAFQFDSRFKRSSVASQAPDLRPPINASQLPGCESASARSSESINYCDGFPCISCSAITS